MKCPYCYGTGKIQLLTSTKPCEACGGTGEVPGPIAWLPLSEMDPLEDFREFQQRQITGAFAIPHHLLFEYQISFATEADAEAFERDRVYGDFRLNPGVRVERNGADVFLKTTGAAEPWTTL